MLGSLWLAGCHTQRNAFRRAARVHRESIGYVAAYAPFLQLPAPAAAGARHGARVARQQITRHAATALDALYERGAPPPVTRIARGFERLLRACAVTVQLEEDAATEGRRALACQEAIAQLDQVLLLEDQRAVAAGLPAGTIPRVDPAVANRAAAQEAVSLAAFIAPGPAELRRAARFAEPQAAPEELRLLCQEALNEAQRKPRGVYEEIERLCQPLPIIDRLLRGSSDCGKDDNPVCGPGLCATLEQHAGRPDLPAVHRERLAAAARLCMSRPPI